MSVVIYQPAQHVGQSAAGKTRFWILEHDAETRRQPESLMGWTSAGDCLHQVRLRFDSKERATAFAESKGWNFTVQEPAIRRFVPRNYAEKFRPDRGL